MIYAVNKQTKEHKSEREIPRLADGWRIIQADADGWIPWSGKGECPLPESAPCNLIFRGATEKNNISFPASFCDWSHRDNDNDIIAYRPILEPQPSEWRGPQDGLPPVGWCGAYSPMWHACEVVAYHKGFAVVWDAHDLEYFRTKDPSIFRPIRSERERWVENAHDAAGYSDNNLFRKVAGKIYDALKSGDLRQP